MNTKTELENFYLLSIRANTLQNRIDRLESMVNRVNSWPDNDPVKGGKSSQEDLMIRLADMRRDYAKTINSYLDQYESVMQTIDAMDDPLYAEIILERYVDGKLWKEIADNVSMSESHVRGYLHNKAVDCYKSCKS